MVGDINIEKYGIRSVSMISEASWSPRILIRHMDGREFSYAITREYINSDIDVVKKLIKEHIRKECIIAQRKEKLEKIDSIQKLKFVDIQL